MARTTDPAAPTTVARGPSADARTVTGVQSIELGYLQIRVSARTTPANAIDVGLALRRRAAQALSEAGLSTSLAFSTTESKANAGVPSPPTAVRGRTRRRVSSS